MRSEVQSNDLQEHEIEYMRFLAQNGRSISDRDEYNMRLNIFGKHYYEAKEFNQDKSYTFRKGITKFSDWTEEEFNSIQGFKPELKGDRGLRTMEEASVIVAKCDAPDSIDWRTKGAVTEVKNQGSCGSCWTFSATGAFESAWFLAGNDLSNFSEQQLVDCVKDIGGCCMGCDGGLMDPAFTYLHSKGFDSWTDYPYTATDGTCHATPTNVKTQGASGFIDVTKGSDDALKCAASHQPVAVAIDAGALQTYSGGIISGTWSCFNTGLNHGVLVVGYGTDSKTGMDYWIVKNSWGEDWGESGYFKAERGVDCMGIADSASVPDFGLQ